MDDLLLEAVKLGEKLGVEFVELRCEESLRTSITTKDGGVEVVREGFEKGVNVRVLARGAWGVVSTSKTDRQSVFRAVEDAYRLALALSQKVKEKVKLAEVKQVKDKVTLKPKKDPRNIPIEQKIGDILGVDKTVFSLNPQTKSCTIDYLDVFQKEFYVNSEGANVEQNKIYVWFRVYATATEADVFASAGEEFGSTSGYDVFDENPPEKVGVEIARRLGEQLKAKTPKGGVFPAVLGSNVVGVFVHEAFGHLAEADLTLSGSVVLDKLGKKIASDVVTIFDDGTVEGAFGSFMYDDEGVKTQKTLLVKDGFIVGLMHNRETAKKFNSQPTGNARAENFRYTPIIRMRNTYLEPRDHRFEELLEPIKFGYYLKTFRGGQANLDGTFHVGVQEAYEIVKGEVGEPVRNMSISGNTLETLMKVEAVGKDFRLWPGRCGKGQLAFVCDGGPSIRVGEVRVGGRG
ncbi:MAG: TldD/PmbA family protein [Candidatus Hecatellales archaeon]|nr:MAG: TldD/PmbA family protein [Candidatus Hecatellales archaeon]